MTHWLQEWPEAAQSKTVVLRYDNLVAAGGTLTDVRMTVYVTLKDQADYYLIRARVDNSGKYGITNLYSGSGELVADASREKEALAAPGWSCGTVWENPYAFFGERETFGYPMFGSQAGLDAA